MVDSGGVGPPVAHIVAAKPARYYPSKLAKLGAVVPAAGPGPVGGLGGIVRVGAGLVLVVGLVVPGPVVEILVLVGGLGAVEPVDGDALGGAGVRGLGVVAGVGVSGAADRPEARAVGLDVGVAGRGAGLYEGVVGRDIGGRAVALGGGEEQQPELGAGGHGGGLEAPVRGDLGGGGQHGGGVGDGGDVVGAGGEGSGVVAGGVLDGGGVVAGRGVGVGDDDGLALADGRRNRDQEKIRMARPRRRP